MATVTDPDGNELGGWSKFWATINPFSGATFTTSDGQEIPSGIGGALQTPELGGDDPLDAIAERIVLGLAHALTPVVFIGLGVLGGITIVGVGVWQATE